MYVFLPHADTVFLSFRIYICIVCQYQIWTGHWQIKLGYFYNFIFRIFFLLNGQFLISPCQLVTNVTFDMLTNCNLVQLCQCSMLLPIFTKISVVKLNSLFPWNYIEIGKNVMGLEVIFESGYDVWGLVYKYIIRWKKTVEVREC